MTLGLGSRIRKIAKPSFSERIFFLHLEKCGGTSIQSAIHDLYRDFRFSDIKRVHHLDHVASLNSAMDLAIEKMHFRDYLLRYLLESERYRYVRGHFQVDSSIIEKYSLKWKFVTILRDPVKRFISHYNANHYKDHSHDRIDLPLEEYLQTDRAREFGQDYVTILTGRSSVASFYPVGDEMIQEALRNLSAFHIAGILENLDRFASQFEKETGAVLTIHHKNINPGQKEVRNKKMSGEILSRIETMCAPNIVVYEFLKNRLALHGF